MINPCYSIVVQPINVVGDLYLKALNSIYPLEVVGGHLILVWNLYNVQKIESLCPGVDTSTIGVDTCIPRFQYLATDQKCRHFYFRCRHLPTDSVFSAQCSVNWP